MKRENRLSSKARFARVYSQGRAWSNSLLVLKALANGEGVSRFGFAVGKRLGGAVVRNRVRRLLRESLEHQAVRVGWDMVFVPRRPAVDAGLSTIKRAVEELLSRSCLGAAGRGENKGEENCTESDSCLSANSLAS